MKFAFDDCILDLAARQLWRSGQAVSLEPKMFDLLDALIRRRPAVVTNTELDELLWPNVYVERTSLTRLVSELRALLGDSPRDSRIIRTVYKKGYAFCAIVTTPDRSPAQPTPVSIVWRDMLLPLTEGENIAGRGAECTLVIDANTVSRRHARFTLRSGTVIIEDLGSTNGTHVNGARIDGPLRLSDGIRIALGSESLLVRIRNPTDPTVKL